MKALKWVIQDKDVMLCFVKCLTFKQKKRIQTFQMETKCSNPFLNDKSKQYALWKTQKIRKVEMNTFSHYIIFIQPLK